MREPKTRRAGTVRFGACAVLALLLTGCRAGGSPTADLISRTRVVSLNKPATVDPEVRAAWDRWARENLRTGDILFSRGDVRLLFGLFEFSKFLAQVTDSPYSHAAVISVEDGHVYVYDTILNGPRRQPFGKHVVENAEVFAVKRLRPPYRRHIPAAVDFCRAVYERRIPFDKEFRLGNDRLYCTEMTEMAFRHAGLALSGPVHIKCLPGYDSRPNMVAAVRMFSSLRPEQRVLVPGNESIGVWSNPRLEFVCRVSDPRCNPPAAGVARVAEAGRY